MGFGKKALRYLWDAACVGSLVGVWPRFIEPNLLDVVHLTLRLSRLPKGSQLRVALISDLHICSSIPDFFLNHVIHELEKISPDVTLFAGDFLCYARMAERERLAHFLERCPSRFGCFAVPGNHDYEHYVGFGKEGKVQVLDDHHGAEVLRGLGRLFFGSKPNYPGKHEAMGMGMGLALHPELVEVLADSPFRLLNNETVQVEAEGFVFNLSGLGDRMAGLSDEKQTGEGLDPALPTLTLLHNPDTVQLIDDLPSDLLLCGHVHGGQVNLPWIRDKLVMIEYAHMHRGLHRERDRLIYVNRGLSSPLRFRWFARPEVTSLTLKHD